MKSLLLGVCVAGMSLVGCGSDDDSGEPAAGTSTGSELSLSSGFTSTCASSGCHGSTGTNGSASNLVTYAKANTLEAFIAVLRSPPAGMTTISEASYSDATAEADYNYFNAQ